MTGMDTMLAVAATAVASLVAAESVAANANDGVARAHG